MAFRPRREPGRKHVAHTLSTQVLKESDEGGLAFQNFAKNMCCVEELWTCTQYV